MFYLTLLYRYGNSLCHILLTTSPLLTTVSHYLKSPFFDQSYMSPALLHLVKNVTCHQLVDWINSLIVVSHGMCSSSQSQPTFEVSVLCSGQIQNLCFVLMWRQVAAVLLFSQRVAFTMLLQGHSRIGNLADSTTRFIEDHVADFIVSNGGWVSRVVVIFLFTFRRCVGFKNILAS